MCVCDRVYVFVHVHIYVYVCAFVWVYVCACWCVNVFASFGRLLASTLHPPHTQTRPYPHSHPHASPHPHSHTHHSQASLPARRECGYNSRDERPQKRVKHTKKRHTSFHGRACHVCETIDRKQTSSFMRTKPALIIISIVSTYAFSIVNNCDIIKSASNRLTVRIICRLQMGDTR